MLLQCINSCIQRIQSKTNPVCYEGDLGEGSQAGEPNLGGGVVSMVTALYSGSSSPGFSPGPQLTDLMLGLPCDGLASHPGVGLGGQKYSHLPCYGDRDKLQPDGLLPSLYAVFACYLSQHECQIPRGVCTLSPSSARRIHVPV